MRMSTGGLGFLWPATWLCCWSVRTHRRRRQTARNPLRLLSARARRSRRDSRSGSTAGSGDVWERATPLTDFVQKEPTEGEPPSERMECASCSTRVR